MNEKDEKKFLKWFNQMPRGFAVGCSPVEAVMAARKVWEACHDQGAKEDLEEFSAWKSAYDKGRKSGIAQERLRINLLMDAMKTIASLKENDSGSAIRMAKTAIIQMKNLLGVS